MKDLPALLRVALLAELLGLTAHGVRAMCRRGEIPASRVGSQWIVRRDAWEAHLKRKERHARRPQEDANLRLLRALSPPRRSGAPRKLP